MRWKSHVRFGGRAGETDHWKQRHGAPVRSHWFAAGLTLVQWSVAEIARWVRVVVCL